MTLAQSNPATAPQRPKFEAIPAHAVMLDLVNGYRISQAIYVAAKLGIADLLAQGAKTCDQLAEATNVHAPSLYRVLRALANIKIFAQTETGAFELTPLAQTLRSDDPETVRPAALLFLDPWHWQIWSNFSRSVETGKTALEATYGVSKLYEYLPTNPEIARLFDRAIASNSTLADDIVANAYDFGQVSTLVDVGGGRGSLLFSILRKFPQLKAILFDRPQAIAGVNENQLIQSAGLSDRCDAIGGDFFQALPAGADAYLFKHIIHNWDDQASIAILKSCRRAIAPNGKILLAELIVPPGNIPSISKALDLQMLGVLGGLERTEIEYRGLLDSAGFRVSRIIPTPSPWSIIEGVPV